VKAAAVETTAVEAAAVEAAAVEPTAVAAATCKSRGRKSHQGQPEHNRDDASHDRVPPVS
jgi:hypothetical protein